MSKKAIFFILLILVIGGFFAYFFYREGIFSKEILRLEILGPDSAKAGDEIEYTIKYKNNGNFVLEQPKLVFEIPEDSLTEDGKSRIAQDLKDIYPGSEEFVKFKIRLLGKENDLKAVKASLSYIPKNLTARYEADTTFTTKIGSVPVTLDFDLPTKLEKGKDVQFSVNYFSNIDYPLENLGVKIDSVQGFDFSSSDPYSLDGSFWKLPTLNKAQGGRIKIKGKINSDAGGILTFSAHLGMWQNGDFIVIKETTIDAEIINPLLSISQQINGSPNYVASPGETLHYQIFFRNIGSTPFDNLFMIVNLDGAALDASTILAPGGQVQPSNNMIVWDSKQIDELRHLGVQQEGSVSFDVKLKTDWNNSSSDKNNTTITSTVNVSQITQKFEIKVNSGLVISQSAFYQDPNFSNLGPIPPKAGKETAYSVTWEVKNYFSDAKNVKVKAILPSNVTLTGKILPEDESSKFSFDSKSREIVWSAGDIQKGTGVNGDPVLLSFQISLTQDASQKGSLAQLIGQANISGENQFTNTTITSSDSAIDTSLPDDPANSGKGIVQ